MVTGRKEILMIEVQQLTEVTVVKDAPFQLTQGRV